MKKVLKIAAIALLAVLAVVLLYVGYVFGTYSRIEDNQALSVTQGSGGVQTAEADTEYKVLCWNIGFGAYEDDFGFFMDGGTESRAWSKERLTANIEAIGRTIADENPDISICRRSTLTPTGAITSTRPWRFARLRIWMRGRTAFLQ